MSCQERSKDSLPEAAAAPPNGRPFVDENQQLHYPENSTAADGRAPIYFHFHGHFKPLETAQSNQLNGAYEESRAAFLAWKKLKELIIARYFTRT